NSRFCVFHYSYDRFFLLYFLYCDDDHRHLHSFPTRRSSDLPVARGGGRNVVAASLFTTQSATGDLLKIQRRIKAGTPAPDLEQIDRKSTRLNSSHVKISYAVFCLKKKKNMKN